MAALGVLAQWLSGLWLRGPRRGNHTTHKTYLQLIPQLIEKTRTTHTTHRGKEILYLKFFLRDELYELYMFLQ